MAGNVQKGILIIVENLPVPFDRRVWQEATALREAGYNVSVICPKGKGYDDSYEELQGISIYRHSLPHEGSGPLGYLLEYSTALFWQLLLSFRARSRQSFDAIHACNPPDLIFLVAAVHKLLFGSKFLFDQHDLNPELFEVKFGRRSGLLYRLICLFEKATFRLADRSIATNETFRDIAVTRGGMNPDCVTIVRSYPDISRFRRVAPRQSLRGKYRYLVGYVGIMGPQDGVDLLIQAMAHIHHRMQRTDIGCIIIGSGSELEALKRLALDLNVSDTVTFAGYQKGDDLLEHLSTLDIGIIPDPPNSFNNKLSMNKVFEYMMIGLPFVQFDLPQSRLEAGDAGYVAEDCSPAGLAAAMVKVLEDEPLRRTMASEGEERARAEFLWEREKARLLEAYENLFK